jgi:nucleotide-binding universal stress UspA family protein
MAGIIVGIDGTPAADAALDFALEEAKLRKLPLRVVCAWEIPPHEYAGAAVMAAPDFSTMAEQHAEEILAEAARKIGPDAGIHVETASINGHPSKVLCEQAEGAAMVVVGTRGHGGVASAVLGSVSTAVAHHCACPVVIVRAS